MRYALLTLTLGLAACSQPAPTARPLVYLSAAQRPLVIRYWNGDMVVAPGGLDDAYDTGCLAQATTRFAELGDAGTPLAAYHEQNAARECLARRPGRQ
jgi:hypothetical protein